MKTLIYSFTRGNMFMYTSFKGIYGDVVYYIMRKPIPYVNDFV